MDTGAYSGSIFAGLDDSGVIGSLTISGGVVGGGGVASGEVFSGGGINHATLGDIIGGAGQSSGSISDHALGAITITGTGPGLLANGVTTHGVIGGGGAVRPGIRRHYHQVRDGEGSLQGGAGNGSGEIVSHSTFTPSGDVQGDVGSISITGSITGGMGINSGQISAAGNIRTVTVAGNVTGAEASGTGGILAGVDLTSSFGGDITTLKIGGALEGASVPAGAYVVNGSGYVEAGHDWSITAGSIVAGSVGIDASVTDDGAILAAN